MQQGNRKSRRQLLNEINEVSFAAYDLLLFLDTHPCDEKALSCYREVSEKRNVLLDEYAKYYGPLTADTAALNCADTWQWVEQPFPWEKEGGCR